MAAGQYQGTRILILCFFAAIGMATAADGGVLYRNTFDTPIPVGGDPILAGSEGVRMEGGLISVAYSSEQTAPPGGVEVTLPESPTDPAERRIEMTFLGGGTDISNSLFISYAVSPGDGWLLPPLPAGATFGATRSGYIMRLIRHGDGSNEIKLYRADGGWTNELKSDWTVPFNPVTALRKIEILHRQDGEHRITARFDTGIPIERTYRFEDAQYPPGGNRRGLQVIAKGHTGLRNTVRVYTDTWLVTDAALASSEKSAVPRAKPAGPPDRRGGTNVDTDHALTKAGIHYEKGELAAGRDLCVGLIDQDSMNSDALDLLGRIEASMGNFSSAHRYTTRALDIRREKHGSDHPKVAESLTHLGRIHGVRDPFEAESLYQSSQAIREKTLGPDHPSIAENLADLAALYQRQNRWPEAQLLYERALSIREKDQGTGQWDLSNLLAVMAKLYRDMDQYDTAERAYRRALDIGEKVKGRDSPDLMGIMRNLAHFYRTYERDDKAAPLNERLVGIMEKSLGPYHTDVADNLNDLAIIYHFQGRHAEAERGFRRVIEIRERSLGKDNPKTGGAVFNMALAIYAQGRISEAGPHYERSLAIMEKDVGLEHPVLVDALNNLAAVYYAEGRYAKAEPLFRRALAIHEKSQSGEPRPEMANVLENLSNLYRAMDRPIESEFYGQRMRKIREKHAVSERKGGR